VACAAALAALEVFEQEDMPARSRALAPKLESVLHSFKGSPCITDIRNIGLMGALEFAPRDGDPLVRPYEMGVKCWERGLYVRWGADTLQFAPPFVATSEDLERMGEILTDALVELK
jgi:beta-alanine--pyruvate transaminase